ncbi:MAG: cache domain-containing protein, partial [Treponemataceae bacterium]|nr:cache domain-containing protein [Treponemataceae bacterium]
MKNDNFYKISKRRFFLIPGICTLILFVVAIFLMNHYTSKMMESHVTENNEYLFEINKHIATTIDERIYTNLVLVNSISTMINNPQEFEKQKIADFLKAGKIEHNFMRISIIKPDGTYIENGKEINVSSREYFKEALKGNPYISDILTSKLTGEEVIIYASPIKNSQQVLGVLIGVQSKESLEEYLSIQTFNNEGFTKIIDKNANYILSSKSTKNVVTNVYDKISNIWQDEETGKNRINEIIKNRETGVFSYTSTDEQEYTLIYTPMSHNNWYLFTMVPSHILPNKEDGHTQLIFVL